jgi:hypothetical protein
MLQLRRQGRRGLRPLARTAVSYLCSWILELFAGYGYRPVRILVAYALVIGAFMTLYYVQGLAYGPRVSWAGSLLQSVAAFGGLAYLAAMAGPSAQHGFPPAAVAIEGLVGLVFAIGLVLVLARRFLSYA